MVVFELFTQEKTEHRLSVNGRETRSTFPDSTNCKLSIALRLLVDKLSDENDTPVINPDHGKPKPATSIHVTWAADDIRIQDLDEFELSCSMQVLESAPATYFSMIGWNGGGSGGYGGIQEDKEGNKKIIFSQWDSKIREVYQVLDRVEG